MAHPNAPPAQYAAPTAPGPLYAQTPQPVPQPAYNPHPPTTQGGAQVAWSNGFWDCFSPGKLCCMAYWCPCFVFGKAHHRLKEPSMETYSPVNLHCFGWCLLTNCGLFWILQMLQRGEVRSKYNLEGSGLGDCCRPYCCPCCELMQEEKELLLRTNSSAQPAHGYQKNEGGMTYGSQPGH